MTAQLIRQHWWAQSGEKGVGTTEQRTARTYPPPPPTYQLNMPSVICVMRVNPASVTSSILPATALPERGSNSYTHHQLDSSLTSNQLLYCITISVQQGPPISTLSFSSLWLGRRMRGVQYCWWYIVHYFYYAAHNVKFLKFEQPYFFLIIFCSGS